MKIFLTHKELKKNIQLKPLFSKLDFRKTFSYQLNPTLANCVFNNKSDNISFFS